MDGVHGAELAYAVVTEQFGLVPGCAVSAVVTIHGFMAGSSDPGGTGAGTLDLQLDAGGRR